MARLIADGEKKVLLVLNNLRAHHANLVTVWLDEHKDRIELFYHPAYSAQYNPDALLNSAIKRKAGVRQSAGMQPKLEANV